jgi:signal transduction histidine kinase
MPGLRSDRPARVLPFGLLMAVPLIFRRRYPSAVFAIIAGAAFVQWADNIPLRPIDLTLLVALYTVAAYGEHRRDGVAAAAVTVGGALLADVRWHNNHFWPGLVAPLALALFAVALGNDRRTRRAYFAGLEERAERLERERDALAQVATAAERARIARELHDVVAHSLSVMVAQADGASYAIATDPGQARRAMETVAETGRDALNEMRRLLGVLRPAASESEFAPQPGVDAIPSLVARVRDAGLPVELVIDGAEAPLPSGMELAAYRVVQEALTNTIKHSGPGASAHVALHYGAGALEVRVDDDGAGIRRPSADGPGHGLAGMRERVAMYGGTLLTGPRPNGGFAVTAAFPFGPGAA